MRKFSQNNAKIMPKNREEIAKLKKKKANKLKKKEKNIQKREKKIKKIKKKIKIIYVNSPIMNQLSYHVDDKKIKKKGLILKSNIDVDIKDTLLLFKNLKNEM